MRDDVLKATAGLEQFQLFLACVEKIIGWCVIFPGKLSTDVYEENDSYYIYTYVQTAYQRQGVGKALLTEASAWAQKEGVTAEVFAWNTKSEEFFSSCQDRAGLPIEIVIEYV
jgi:GNAT superfamily N-acetyltransferase